MQSHGLNKITKFLLNMCTLTSRRLRLIYVCVFLGKVSKVHVLGKRHWKLASYAFSQDISQKIIYKTFFNLNFKRKIGILQ